MATKNSRKCIYNECMLPKNNNRYWFQFVCLAISLVFMQINPEEFSLLSVFMFTVPILLDLMCTDLNGKIYNVIRVVFLVSNILIVVVCIVGQFGMLIDNGSYFSIVSTSMIGANQTISKKVFLWFAISDLLVPVLLYFSSPNQQTSEALTFVLEKKGA